MTKRLLLIGLLLLTVITMAQAQVQIILQQPPPFQFHIEQLWNITLVSPGNVSYPVYLNATIEETKTGIILSFKTGRFMLNPGTRKLLPRELNAVTVNESNSRYSRILGVVGGVPSGDYQICVEVIDSENGVLMGTQCIQHTVQNLTQVGLLSPSNGVSLISSYRDEEDVVMNLKSTTATKQGFIVGKKAQGSRIEYNPDFLFNWLPPSPLPPSGLITYRLRIVEVLRNQSPSDAMRSNPAFFDNKSISTPILQYPLAARPFETGKKYAWKVDVLLNGTKISESEIWDFRIEDNEACKTNVSVDTINAKGSSRSEHDPYEPTSQSMRYSDFEPPLSESIIYKRGLLRVSAFDNNILITDNDEVSATNIRTNETKPFEFTGSIRINGFTANRKASLSEQAPSRGSAEFNPVLAFYGLPFATNLLLSSEQGADRQSINSFGFNFDWGLLRESLMARFEKKIKDVVSLQSNKDEFSQVNDPQKLIPNLKKYGLISTGEKFFLSIRSLGIGAVYPTYTPYTLSGVAMRGACIEINPGSFYFAFSGGRDQRAVEPNQYKSRLFAGRIGFGKVDDTHLYLTGLYAFDDEKSLPLAATEQFVTPKANYVVGVSTLISLFSGRFALEGETAASLLTRNINAPAFETEMIPAFLTNLLKPNISSSIDFTYSARALFNNDGSGTRITAGLKMVGPGFTSAGAPNLRNDIFGFEGTFDQRLFGRKLTFTSFFRQNRDNLINWKTSTTTTTAFGMNMLIRIPKLPYLAVSYSPNWQKNDKKDSIYIIENKTKLFSIMGGHSYRIGGINNATNISASLQDGKTVSVHNNFASKTYMVSHSAGFNIPLTVAGSFGVTRFELSGTDSRITTFDLSGSYLFFQKWQNTFGFSTAGEKNKSAKFSFYLSSSTDLGKYLRLEIRAGRIDYTDVIQQAEGYGENMLSGTLSVNW